ncbi:MAG: metallophosphoesterase [Lachnospiraceae bacterium]|nr:metallophosphoesterase [Lachnospiraceae bacterium]
MNKKAEYIFCIENEKQDWERKRLEILEWEEKYSKPIEDISVSDFESIKLSNVYFILGNHDYIGFPNVQSCVEYYKQELSKYGVIVLHNEYVETNKYLIYGGTGFAKYDNEWNAHKLICCDNFTREDEIKETTFFEEGYKNALAYAKEKGLCFICAAHYPISACLNNLYDRETIYFTGHNHRNEYLKTNDKVLYADNQIGYENNNVFFKIATTGVEINPYNMLKDGLYQTTVEEYLQFYRYLGEGIGEGRLLYQRCQNGNLYVVKRKGYYGFFIISKSKRSKGISIVDGGKTKKLTTSTDISWICENFDIVVSKYLQILLPLRRAQDKLSKELKELGLDGTIHGLIVDIDFTHHIAINPMNGTMQFYYSSIWGMVMNLNSFDEVIQSLEYHKSSWDDTDYKLIQTKYIEKSQSNGYLLSINSNNYLLESETYEVDNISQRMEQVVSRTDGMYGVSRKISPLQRLFTGRVLRDFDLRLTETKQQASHRKKLYIGRVFNYEGIRYQIIEDDGGDIVIAEELQKGSRSKCKGVVLSGKRRKFAIENLKAKIKKYEAYWLDE